MASHLGYRPGAGRKPGRVAQAKRDLAEAAKGYADAALQVLVDLARDETASPSARVSAATAILDRGFGRPAQSMQVEGPALRPTRIEIVAVGLDDEAAAARH